MLKFRRGLYFAAALALPLAIPGCLITTQSYNHGKLLNPGERLVTHGFGCLYSSRYLPRRWTMVIDSAGNYVDKAVMDSTRFGWFAYTYDYRVGVLRKYPFGRGLEAGFHLEMAFRGDKYGDWDGGSRTEPEFNGPPVLEIDTRFGLPDITLRKSIFHHNVNAGWMVGYWVDNGWFLGYAAGWEFSHFIPYCSTRLFITATDAFDRDIDSTFFKTHDRKWGARFSGGVSYRLPFNFSLIPEFITPECSFAFPNFSAGQHIGFSASVGIRWMLGQ